MLGDRASQSDVHHRGQAKYRPLPALSDVRRSRTFRVRQKKLRFFVSQPGIGSVWTSGTRRTAASVLLKPPGFVNSTSAAAIYSATWRVKPMICTFWVLMELQPERTHSVFLLFPQMITACSPFSSRETSSCASRCTLPNPILPLMTRNSGAFSGRPRWRRTSSLDAGRANAGRTGIPRGS